MATVIRGDDNWDTALKAGSEAFAARFTSGAWGSYSDGAIVPFNNASTGDSFDTGSNYNTATYKYVAPTTGVYTFWASVYTAQNDSDNRFSFFTNGTRINYQYDSGSSCLAFGSGTASDHILAFSAVISLAVGDEVSVNACEQSDVYGGNSSWGGCRLS